jgi:hypothetical protein
MSGRGPDPKELRASLVDSGWSVAPPAVEAAELIAPDAEVEPDDPSTRRLPNYEDGPTPAVTQVDADIQSRLKAMQRASIGDGHRPPLPPLPPPPPSRPPPPSLPPPPPPPHLPPRSASEAPLPSFGTASAPDTESRPAGYTPPRGSHSEPAEATEVMPRGAVLPSSEPPAFAPPRPPVQYLQTPTPSMLPAVPSLLTALRQRVRFAGGEVPLWSLLTPMVLLLALASAFVAVAVSGSSGGSAVAPSASANASAAAASPTPSAATSLVEPASEPPAAATQQAPALPATSIDTEALEARRAEELTKDEALALASARRERELARVALLRQKLKRDPGLFKDAATLAELRRAAEDPLSAPDALSAMAEAPGPLSADLLYEMWTGTVVRNSATELARSLVFSKEVRAKASPELGIALDLRIAETCEQNLALLPRVAEKGDRRSLGLLAKLSRRFGCGPNKRLDCYPCLREDKAVDDAMTAVKKRREPKPFSGK